MTIHEWGNIHIFASENDREVLMAEKSISHEGVVDSMRGSEIKVKITSYAACNECHAKAACQVSSEKEKVIQVRNTTGQFHAGEKVKIVLAQSLGFRALFLGYILPFLLVFMLLIILTIAGIHEGVAGLISLGILPLYYLTLRLFRDRFERRFSFYLQKA